MSADIKLLDFLSDESGVRLTAAMYKNDCAFIDVETRKEGKAHMVSILLNVEEWKEFIAQAQLVVDQLVTHEGDVS